MTRLAAALEKEGQLLSRLLELLKTEQQILVAGNAEMLEALTQEKNALVGEITEASREREATFLPAPPPAGNEAMTAWLANHPGEKAAAAAWDKLMGLTRLAKEAHEKNGFVIAALIRKTGEALAILTQHQQDHSLYGSDGQTAANTGRRIVDSA